MEKIRLVATKQALGCTKQVKFFFWAKVFYAHARSFCGNLIDALKLLANHLEDGDGLIQNIVTNFGEGSRKGLTQGLREFIKIDNQRALEV